MATTLGALNPFRYRGYVYDEETGLYYLRSRYYNPTWGRFLNADSVLGKSGQLLGHNVFGYCRNSVVTNIDIDGFADIYVFYYHREISNASLKDQAFFAYDINSADANIHMIEVGYSKSFIEEWNKMNDNNIGEIYLFLHGTSGHIIFDENTGDMISFSQGAYTFSDLEPKNVNGMIYLYSCHGADGNNKENVARFFASLCKTSVLACKCGVSYTKLFGKYIPREEKKELLNPFTHNWRIFRYCEGEIVESILPAVD